MKKGKGRCCSSWFRKRKNDSDGAAVRERVFAVVPLASILTSRYTEMLSIKERSLRKIRSSNPRIIVPLFLHKMMDRMHVLRQTTLLQY